MGDTAGKICRPLSEAAAATLALTPDERVESIAARFQYAERLVLTARGYSYATAREGAPKLMETSYVSAMAFSGADLLHGRRRVDPDRPRVLSKVTQTR